MDLYIFQFEGDTIILQARSERQAICRAYHEVVEQLDVDPARLEKIEWPLDDDYRTFDPSEPVILEGG